MSIKKSIMLFCILFSSIYLFFNCSEKAIIGNNDDDNVVALDVIPASWNGDYADQNYPDIIILKIHDGKIFSYEYGSEIEIFPAKNKYIGYEFYFSETSCSATKDLEVVKYIRDGITGEITEEGNGSNLYFVKYVDNKTTTTTVENATTTSNTEVTTTTIQSASSTTLDVITTTSLESSTTLPDNISTTTTNSNTSTTEQSSSTVSTTTTIIPTTSINSTTIDVTTTVESATTTSNTDLTTTSISSTTSISEVTTTVEDIPTTTTSNPPVTTSSSVTINTTTTTLSNNNSLSSLAITNIVLEPVFFKDIVLYDSTIDSQIKTTMITATNEDDNANNIINLKISKPGGSNLYRTVTSGIQSAPIDLETGLTTIEIKVTAQDFTTKTYTVKILRLNNLPVVNIIKPENNQIFSRNDYIYFNCDATDDPGTIFFYKWYHNASIFETAKSFSVTASSLGTGISNIIVEVSDGDGGIVSKDVTIDIQDHQDGTININF